MAQEKEFFAFISVKRYNFPTANRWSCSNVVLHRSSSGASLVTLWLSYRTLKWIRSIFLDEPSDRSASGCLFPKGIKKAEREEDSKFLRRYAPLMNINSLAHETDFVASRRYVLETMNLCFNNMFN